MKKTYTILGVSTLLAGLAMAAQAQQIPAAPVVAPQGQAITPTQKPQTGTTAAPVAAGVTTTPPAAAVPATTAPAAAPEAVQVSDADFQTQLQNTMANEFKDQLSFPLDEQKMIAYAQATRRVQKINDKWDVQIAAADTDQTAIEYNNFSVEEIMASLKNIPNLTLDQYNEMTRLASTKPEFNRVYLAYKDLLEQGKIVAPEPAAKAPEKPTAAKKPYNPKAPVAKNPSAGGFGGGFGATPKAPVARQNSKQ